jgi:hypothetical protein
VVFAEDASTACQRVFIEFAGLLVFAQLTQVGGEVASHGEGVGVVYAQDVAAAVKSVLVELGGCPASRGTSVTVP